MVCHGGFSLDEKTRRSWYNPEDILQATGLEEGMTFVDVGCADGFFTFLAAKMVGETGQVYAVDIDKAAIDRLNARAKAEGFKNIKAVAGRAEDTVFCKNCADVVFFGMVLHDFEQIIKVLHNAQLMLDLDGVVADLDWKKIDIPFGPPLDVKFNPIYVIEQMQSAGIMGEQTFDVGPYHYLVLARSGL
jgi:ubiquinone/menaquinone biosynthesis C-methylase UbiE